MSHAVAGAQTDASNMKIMADLNLPSSIQEEIPTDALSQSTLKFAYGSLPPSIFNHSLRVYLLSKWLAASESIEVDQALLLTASLCHDLGATDLYNGAQRFEVEGADAACEHMRDHGVSNDSDLHKVWTAIALHTSTGIAERIDPFTRLMRVGVKIDFSQETRKRYNATSYAEEIEKALPRLEIEKVLGDAVVNQAVKIPTIDRTIWPDSEKHPKASWPGILLRAHIENPEWDGVNLAF